MKLSDAQLWEIVSQMKGVIEQDAEQAFRMLVASPAVGLAILKAQYRLGMVTAESINKLMAAAAAPPRRRRHRRHRLLRHRRRRVSSSSRRWQHRMPFDHSRSSSTRMSSRR